MVFDFDYDGQDDRNTSEAEEAIEEALWEVEATPDLLEALEDVRNGNVVDVDINDLKVD